MKLLAFASLITGTVFASWAIQDINPATGYLAGIILLFLASLASIEILRK